MIDNHCSNLDGGVEKEVETRPGSRGAIESRKSLEVIAGSGAPAVD